MLVAEFWQWFGFMLAGLALWCLLGFFVAWFFGCMCKFGSENDE